MFRPARDEYWISQSKTCGVITLYGWCSLFPSHFCRDIVQCHCVSCCDKQSTSFSFCCWRHSIFQYLCNGHQWSVPTGNGVIFRQETVSICSATRSWFDIEPCILVGYKHHVIGSVINAIIWVCSTVVQELCNCFLCVLCSRCLLGFNCTQCHQNLVINCSRNIQ